MMYGSQFHKTEHYDWFCAPGSHIHNNSSSSVKVFSVNQERNLQRLQDKTARNKHVSGCWSERRLWCFYSAGTHSLQSIRCWDASPLTEGGVRCGRAVMMSYRWGTCSVVRGACFVSRVSSQTLVRLTAERRHRDSLLLPQTPASNINQTTHPQIQIISFHLNYTKNINLKRTKQGYYSH